MKKNKVFYFKCIISAVLLLGIILHLIWQKSSYEQMMNASWSMLTLLFLSHILNYIFLGLSHAQKLKVFNIHLKMKEWFALSVVAELFNYALPAKGGTIVRYFYLKEKFKLKFSDFMMMTTTYIFIGLSFLGGIGLIITQILFDEKNTLIYLLQGLLLLLTFSSPIFIWSYHLFPSIRNKLSLISPSFFLSQKKILFNCSLLYILIFVLYPFKIAFSFYALGIDINPRDLTEISLILLILSLFPILPSNIGIKEMVTAYIGQHYGMTFDQALLASVIDRIVLNFFIIPYGLFGYWDLILKLDAKVSLQGLSHLRESLVKND